VADGRSSGRSAGEGMLCNAESIRGDEGTESHAAQRRAEQVARRFFFCWADGTANGEMDAAG